VQCSNFEAADMTITDELFQIADDAAEALNRIRDESLRKPLTAIRKVCEEAKRAWSGSNIGYHATVYFDGIRPKPPEAQFSGEWGMMDRWPTHQPHPGWCIMDCQAVIDELLTRAGKPDLEAIGETLAPIQGTFSSLKIAANGGRSRTAGHFHRSKATSGRGAQTRKSPHN
jgi:hypothetical protein